MENRLVPPAGIPLDTISFNGLRGKGAKGALLGGFKLLKGFAECARILKDPPGHRRAGHGRLCLLSLVA
jgi:UDP-N-acetylglucosamine--N-acetylmuramyl-(pentapeptide) pyrophosphoryl-undecaprenol N-acetylglucosamine transferase